jgi:putative transposase
MEKSFCIHIDEIVIKIGN